MFLIINYELICVHSYNVNIVVADSLVFSLSTSTEKRAILYSTALIQQNTSFILENHASMIPVPQQTALLPSFPAQQVPQLLLNLQ